MRITERDKRRFYAKIAPPNERGCMLWLAYTDPDGYGRFRVGGTAGEMRRAHRVSYTLAYGPIPEGLTLDHLCRVRHCIAPEHLEAVTNAENVRRGRLNDWQRVKTHCPRGHAYTEENTSWWKGRRSCRTCHRERARRDRARAK